VTATAIAPNLTVDADTIDFGDTQNGSAGRQEIKLNNTGDATLTIEQPEITGSDADNFRILSGNQTLQIAAQGSQNVSVGFAPDNTTVFNDSTLNITPANSLSTSTRVISSQRHRDGS